MSICSSAIPARMDRARSCSGRWSGSIIPPTTCCCLGGDLTWQGTGTRKTVDYLDAVFDLSSPSTLAVLGNHDTSHKDYFTDVTGRPRYYAVETNDVMFVLLDTTDDGQNILGAELQMLTDTINALPDNSHLVIVHHHII